MKKISEKELFLKMNLKYWKYGLEIDVENMVDNKFQYDIAKRKLKTFQNKK